MLVPFEKTNDERIKIYSTVRSASYTRSCSYQHCYLLHIADAKIRNVLSAAIVEFHEGDLLFKLKEKWWKTRNPPDAAALEKCHIYSNASSGSSNSEMGLSSVGGVFIVLFVGCLAGTIIGIGEFVWELQKIPYGERVSKPRYFFGKIRLQTVSLSLLADCAILVVDGVFVVFFICFSVPP